MQGGEGDWLPLGGRVIGVLGGGVPNGMLFEYVNKCLRANGGKMKEDDARWGG
jgi:hypothetical protein